MNAATWIEEFACEIEDSEVPDRWTLYVDEKLLKKNDAKYYSQKTFGSFRCLHCKRAWTSTKVFILFRMDLKKSWKHGNVKMRIFKQECQTCEDPIMQEPTILNENIKSVISNVVHRIQMVFYENKIVSDDQQPIIYGKLEGPHDEEHCEACRYNLCDRQTMSSQESSTPGLLYAFAAVGVGAFALMCLSKK